MDRAERGGEEEERPKGRRLPIRSSYERGVDVVRLFLLRGILGSPWEVSGRKQKEARAAEAERGWGKAEENVHMEERFAR